jgi:hypothetical protein
MQHVARVLLELGGQMPYLKMTTLMYLVDFFSLEKLGHTIASNTYVRQVEGPSIPELDKALVDMQGHEVRRFLARKVAMVGPGPSPRFEICLSDNALEVVADVFRTYGSKSIAEIKNAVFRTGPMQAILRAEKKGKIMVNMPVPFEERTLSECFSRQP